MWKTYSTLLRIQDFQPSMSAYRNVPGPSSHLFFRNGFRLLILNTCFKRCPSFLKSSCSAKRSACLFTKVAWLYQRHYFVPWRYLVHAVEEFLTLCEPLSTGILAVRKIYPIGHAVAPLSLLRLHYATSQENRALIICCQTMSFSRLRLNEQIAILHAVPYSRFLYYR